MTSVEDPPHQDDLNCISAPSEFLSPASLQVCTTHYIFLLLDFYKVSDCIMFYEFCVPKNVELKNIEQESPPLMFSKMRKLTQQKLAVLRYEMLSKSVASFTGKRLVYFGYVNQYFLFSLRHF